jgi:hypothetical protein
VKYETENVAQMPKVQVNIYLWASSQSWWFMGWSRKGRKSGLQVDDGYNIGCIEGNKYVHIHCLPINSTNSNCFVLRG